MIISLLMQIILIRTLRINGPLDRTLFILSKLIVSSFLGELSGEHDVLKAQQSSILKL